MAMITPGRVVLFGSGETSPSGRKAFESIFRLLSDAPRVALLETPAGFELNSNRVIGRVAEFLIDRLQNYHPKPEIVAARAKGTSFSPDDPQIIAPLYSADMIFMGPGSPTYAVRQLKDSLAWQALQARHRLGAPLGLASAAVIAISLHALPVYEIYKVGEDLHWKPGLDFFGPFGLPLVFVPHWNNNDGGEELDTSRCFMGQSRFARLMEMLPPDLTVVGIDEKTALTVDFGDGCCHVTGAGGVTLLHTGHGHPKDEQPDLSGTGLEEVAEQRRGHVHQYRNGESFELAEVGEYHPIEPQTGLPEAVWAAAVEAQERNTSPQPEPEGPPEEVRLLLDRRQAARQNKEWAASDALRQEIAALGWQVQDTPDGQKIQRNP